MTKRSPRWPPSRRPPWPWPPAAAAPRPPARRAPGGTSGGGTANALFTPPADKLAALGTPEGTVNVLAWPGYVEDGTNDPKVDWVTDFREGQRLPGQRQDLRHLRRGRPAMRTGQYDVVSASGDATLRLSYRRRRADEHRPHHQPTRTSSTH